MKRVIEFIVNQKLLINLTVILILLAGLYTVQHTNREAFPEVNFDMVSITTIYPGASPDEMEKLITVPVEKQLREVDGIDKVRSYNVENASVIVLYLEDKLDDKDGVIQDIKDAVGMVEDLPTNAEEPQVEEIKLDKSPVISVAVYQDGGSYSHVRSIADELEDRIYEEDGVADVEKQGYLNREYLVEVSPAAMERYRIGMNSVVNTLKMRNIDLPGGSLRVNDKEYVLRTKGQYENTREILSTAVMANDLGFVTRIGDVARVREAFEETDIYERYNGHDAIIFTIWKKRSADEIEITDRLKEVIADFAADNSEGVTLETFADVSQYTRDSISSVLQNAATGFVLLAIILFMLLGIRLAALVTASIPVSFMVAFFGLKYNDITLNVISMFGMIMVLGMIVDFGIVVTENVHRYVAMGYKKKAAIVKGVSEVFWPVTVTLLSIIAAFAPLLMLSGIFGKFIKAIPLVVMLALAASWFIAMFIMPTMLNIVGTGKPSMDSDDETTVFESGFFGKVQQLYHGSLNMALRHRYITLAVLVVLLFGSLFLSGQIGFVFVPPGGETELRIDAELPLEKNLDASLQEVKKIEQYVLELSEEELDSLQSRVGIESTGFLDPKPGEGTHKSTLLISLTPHNDRERGARTILNEIETKVRDAQKAGEISGDLNLKFTVSENGPPVGKPVNVEIRGEDFAVLEKIAGEYQEFLNGMDGVYDVELDLEEGKDEYRYTIDEAVAAQAGVSVYDIATALNASFEGAIATSVRQGDDDIDIRVRFPENYRNCFCGLNMVKVANMQGGLIPLNAVTNVRKQKGYSAINRLNYKRIVQVQAEIDLSKATSIEVNQAMEKHFSDIEDRYPGYRIAYGGEQEDTSESMGELGVLFLFALLVIFIILAVFMNSLLLPAVVMSAIPFSLVGVIGALWAHGQPLSFMSTLGIFSLAGVIVSNTLVLVQFINNQRSEGHDLKESLLRGGVIRLKPVLLTTGTTVLGLFPTMYGFGGKDFFVAPLALSFGWGLIFATFITLVLIPSFYNIAEDFKGLMAALLKPFGITMNGALYVAEKDEAEDDAQVPHPH